MSDLVYSVRAMQRKDVPQVIDIRKEAKLFQGTQTLYTWLEVDPEAILVAVTESGEVIGCCSAVFPHEDLACFGLYTVRKKYCGKGIGFKIWSACMDRIGTMNACMNAVPNNIELYQNRGGFPLVETEWTSDYYIAHVNKVFHPEALSDIVPKGVEIHSFQDSLLPYMLEYDNSLMGYKRDIAVELSCKEKDSKTLVAIKNGVCVGWGTIKLACFDYAWVGPLYADNAGVAEVILRQLIINDDYFQEYGCKYDDE